MSDQEVLRKLQKIYDDIANAFRAQSLDTVAGFIAADWVGDTGDIVRRERLLESIDWQFQSWHDIEWDRTVDSLRRDGEGWIVRARGTYRARERETEKPIEMILSNDDYWRLTPSGWESYRSVALNE